MEKTINAHMLDHLNDPEIPELVRPTKFMLTVELPGIQQE